LADDILKPAIMDAVIDGVLEAMHPAATSRRAEQHREELGKLDREIGRLTEAIAASGSESLPALLAALKARQQRRDAIAPMLDNAASINRIDRRVIVAAAREKLSSWRSLLTRNVQDGRELLRQVLAGPIRFTPEGRIYRFDGRARLGQLMAGVATPFVASLTGFEPVLPP
jgi:hypothetical protein